jgi:hypothetical protein
LEAVVKKRDIISVRSGKKLMGILGAPIWLSLLLTLPLAQAADADGIAQAKPPSNRLVRPAAAYETAKVKPGGQNSINPQPLPPFPSSTVGTQGAPAAGTTSTRTKSNPQSLRSSGRCPSTGSSQSGNSANAVTPEGIVANCTTRTGSLDSQVKSKMNSSTKASAGASQTSPGGSLNWSASSGQVNTDAELNMIQLQQLMSQRQQAVQATDGLIKGTKGACPPKCPIGN